MKGKNFAFSSSFILPPSVEVNVGGTRLSSVGGRGGPRRPRVGRVRDHRPAAARDAAAAPDLCVLPLYLEADCVAGGALPFGAPAPPIPELLRPALSHTPHHPA